LQRGGCTAGVAAAAAAAVPVPAAVVPADCPLNERISRRDESRNWNRDEGKKPDRTSRRRSDETTKTRKRIERKNSLHPNNDVYRNNYCWMVVGN